MVAKAVSDMTIQRMPPRNNEAMATAIRRVDAKAEPVRDGSGDQTEAVQAGQAQEADQEPRHQA